MTWLPEEPDDTDFVVDTRDGVLHLTPRERAQFEAHLEAIPLTSGEYRVDPSIEERYGPLLDDLNRPTRRDPLARLLRRRDGSPSWLAWAWIAVRGWGR